MKKKFLIQIGEKAKLEISDAYDWYENKKLGLGESFLETLNHDIKSIQLSPNGFMKIGYHRQYPMQNFPYVILYDIVGNTLFIDAVFHTSKNPDNKLIF